MKFITHITPQIVIVVSVMLLLGFVFFVYDLPATPLWITIGLIGLFMLIYWAVQWFYFSKTEDVHEELEAARQENRRQRETHVNYQKEIEQYFLIWVHQMKTPITALKLLINDVPSVHRPALKEEVLQVENYTDLTLSYLKLMNHDTDMKVERVNLDRLIKQIVKRYSVEFINYQTKLEIDVGEAHVLTDARWTSIMIEQLINNAVKYARGKSIRIEFDRQSQKLSVEDTGVGITGEDLPKIFDKGYSGLNGQYNSKSSGIGLYIVDTIAKRLQHPVAVESELGEGSIFTIHFKQTR